MKRRRVERRRWPSQASLFHPPTARPSWGDLDEDVRQELRTLVARMLREYEEQDALEDKEGSDE